MARIIVASYVVRMPVGGYQSWMLQWLVGFQRLGHEVWFVEKSGWPGSCIDPATWVKSDDCSRGTAAWRSLLARFGLENNWCYVDAAGRYHGVSREKIESVFRGADVFIDHMRDCEWEEEAQSAKLRVMVDGEPALTQMRMENRRAAGLHLMEYDFYYSVGLNMGNGRSTAPTAGKQWRPIFDPVVVDLFPNEPPPAGAPFTTIMTWQAHAPMVYQGVTYESKKAEFPKFMDLPLRTTVPLELAVGGENLPTEALLEHGWRLRDPGRATITYDIWRDYISSSLGEFGVCKNYFVATNCGAFSERSAAYLASGRPVVTQETGFSAHLPCGRGLFAVASVEEAAAAIEEIRSHYELHSKCAREIAAEYLRTDKMLKRLLHGIGI